MKKKTQGCLVALIGVPLLWIVAWMLVFNLTDLEDRSSDDTHQNFSGIYRYSVSETNGYTPMVLNPFFDGSRIANNTDIIIRQSPEDTLLVTQQLKDGKSKTREVSLRAPHFYWRRGTLKYFQRRTPKSKIFPGWGHQTRSGTLSKDEQGNLRLSTFGKEKALLFYCIPMMEEIGRHSIELRRQGDAAGDMGD